MGEVYRARDPRLTREVAIKVLPATFSQDPDRLKRFEAEARAAGVLNHPNITAVYDFGTHDEAPYIVTELLEGETLRSRLGPGAISPRKAIDYAVQIAKGLAAAHEKGIVHRDLKPENVFLTKDGRVKILDFGLAKLKLDGGESGQTDVGTVSGGTQPGVVLGTMGYMSPEQVRGKPADKRSDLFSFGTILYEMLAGQRAFRGDTAADTITAILTKEPPDLSQTNKDVPPGLDRIVRHCLEKNPEERFESARDVAFDLEALSGLSGTSTATRRSGASGGARGVVPGAARTRRGSRGAGRRPVRLLRRQEGRRRRAARASARSHSRAGRLPASLFAPDGQTVVYSASWEGTPFEIFINRPESPESRPFGLPLGRGPRDLEVRRDGGQARRHAGRRLSCTTGRLARISIAGGAPRDILDDVQFADWSPDGKDLAIVRDVGAEESRSSIRSARFSTRRPAGSASLGSPRMATLVAFLDHPVPSDDGGRVAVVDRAGKKRDLSPLYATAQGLVWRPDGGEIWYTAAEGGFNRAVHAVTLAGKVRLVGRVPGISTIRDISQAGAGAHDQRERPSRDPGARAGRAEGAGALLAGLLPRDGHQVRMAARSSSRSREREAVRRTPHTSRGFDGSPAVRLGDGSTEAFSPDGAWAIAITHTATPQIHLLPTSVGEPRVAFPRRPRRLQRRLPARREEPDLHGGRGQAAERGCTCATPREPRRRARSPRRAIRSTGAPSRRTGRPSS